MARTRTRNLDQPEDNTDQDAPVVSDSRRRRRRSSEASDVVQPVATRKDRPTPSARQAAKRGGSSGLISRIPVVRSIAGYLYGVYSELQKVTWPDRDEATRLTGVVLGVTIAFAIALGLLDTFLAWWFRQAFSKDSEIVFLAVALAVAVAAGGTYTMFRKRI